MENNVFSARKLTAMAKLLGKDVMFGVADFSVDLPQSQQAAAIDAAIDELVADRLAVMDFDGGVTLSQECTKLAEVICECELCVILNSYCADGTTTARIMWRYGDEFISALLHGEEYAFSPITADQAIECIVAMLPDSDIFSGNGTCDVPYTLLSRAKRLLNASEGGSENDAAEIIDRCNIDVRIRQVVLDGLKGKADSVMITMIGNWPGELAMGECVFLSSRGVILQVEQKVVELRTSMSFTEISPLAAKERLRTIAEIFAGGEGGDIADA